MDNDKKKTLFQKYIWNWGNTTEDGKNLFYAGVFLGFILGIIFAFILVSV